MGYSEVEQHTVQEVSHHDGDTGHEILHQLGGLFGYGTVLLAVVIGGIIMGRKLFKKWVSHGE